MDSRRGRRRQRTNSKSEYQFHTHKVIKLQPRLNLKGTDCPKPRSGHRIVAIGGNVYAFGGYAPMELETEITHVLFKELWKYNCAAKTWKLLETTGRMPEQVASHCAAIVDNQMLVFGGTGLPFGESRSNRTYSCNLDTLEWKELKTTGTPPSEQYGQAMIAQDKKMYVVGGTNGFSYSISVHCLDLTTKEWKRLDINSKPFDWVPEPRYRHEIAIDDDQIFVFGGGTAHTCFDFREVPVFNLVSNTWSKVQISNECPEARRCHACVQVGSDVYMCGGFDGIISYNSIWKFSLKSLQWQKISATLPETLHFHSAAVSEEGQLFVFGGVSNNYTNFRTNNLYSMWLKIPSLKDICWQAVLKFVPHIPQFEKAKLHEAGVPFQLLKEIDFEPPHNRELNLNDWS